MTDSTREDSMHRFTPCLTSTAALSTLLLTACGGPDAPLSPDSDALLRKKAPGAVSVFAAGLDNPRGLRFGPNGHLYVAEAGTGGTTTTVGVCPQAPPPLGPITGDFTGRVSRLNPAGQRHTVVDELPSSQGSPLLGGDVFGPTDVAFVGRDLHVLVEAGCQNGLVGTFNGVFRVRPNGSLATVANLSEHNMAVFVGPPDDDHGPEGAPYAMARLGGALYVTESNHSALDRVGLGGAVSRVVDFAQTEGHFTPTAIAAGPDGNLYLGNLGEFPYFDGTAKLLRVTPAGQVSTVATGVTAVLGLVFDARGRLYVLESVTGSTPFPPFIYPGSGRVRRWDGTGFTTVATGLTFPSAMTFGPDGALYVSNRGYGAGPTGGLGEILRIEVGR